MKPEQIPSDPDLERLVLGYLMVAAGSMDTARGALENDDFSLEKHRRIWAAICGLYDAGSPIEYITTAKELDRLGQIESVDGMSYVVSLTDGMPDRLDLEHYIAKLKGKTTLRRVLFLADSISKRCMSGAATADEITEALSAGVQELATRAPAEKRAISTREMIDQVGLEELMKPRRTEGVRLPWIALNDALCGLHPGQMIVLAAKTGRGKTSMALQIATHATRQGKSPVLWTLEMSPRQMFSRAVNQLARQDGDRSRHGALSSGEFGKRKDAAYWLHDHPLWFDAHSRMVPSFCASVRQAKAKSDVGLAIVDYLQLIRSTGRAENRSREVGENSRALKLAAMDLEIPFIVLSQFRRMQGDGDATIDDLKESGDIGNDSDAVLLLRTPAPIGGNEPSSVSVWIEKQREGPAGFDIPLIFDPRSQSFYSPEDV